MKVVNKNALQSQNDNADNDDDDMTMRTSRIWEGKSQMNIRANQVWQADLICPIHPPHITHKPFIIEDTTIMPTLNVKHEVHLSSIKSHFLYIWILVSWKRAGVNCEVISQTTSQIWSFWPSRPSQAWTTRHMGKRNILLYPAERVKVHELKQRNTSQGQSQGQTLWEDCLS